MIIVIGKESAPSVSKENEYRTSGHLSHLTKSLNMAQDFVFKKVSALLKALTDNKNNVLKNLKPADHVNNSSCVFINTSQQENYTLNDGCIVIDGNKYLNQRKTKSATVCPGSSAFLVPNRNESLTACLVPGAWYDIQVIENNNNVVYACKFIKRDKYPVTTNDLQPYNTHVLVKAYEIKHNGNTSNVGVIESGSSRLADNEFNSVQECQDASTKELETLYSDETFPKYLRAYNVNLQESYDSVVSLDSSWMVGDKRYYNLSKNKVEFIRERQEIEVHDVINFRGPMVLNLYKNMKNGARSCIKTDYDKEDYTASVTQVLNKNYAASVLQKYEETDKDDANKIDFGILISRFQFSNDVIESYNGKGIVQLKQGKKPESVFSPDIGLCGYMRNRISPMLTAMMEVENAVIKSDPPEGKSIGASTIVRKAAKYENIADQRHLQFGKKHEKDALATLNQYLKTYKNDNFSVKSNTSTLRCKAPDGHKSNLNLHATPDGFVYKNEQIIATVECKCHVSNEAMQSVPTQTWVQCMMQYYVTKKSAKTNLLEYIVLVSWTNKECRIFTCQIADNSFEEKLIQALDAIHNNYTYDAWDKGPSFEKETFTSLYSIDRRITHESYKYYVPTHDSSIQFQFFPNETGDTPSFATIIVIGRVYNDIPILTQYPIQAKVWQTYETTNNQPWIFDKFISEILSDYSDRDVFEVSDAHASLLMRHAAPNTFYALSSSANDKKFFKLNEVALYREEGDKWCKADKHSGNSPFICVQRGNKKLYFNNLTSYSQITQLNSLFFNNKENYVWENIPAFLEGDHIEITKISSSVVYGSSLGQSNAHTYNVYNNTTTLNYEVQRPSNVDDALFEGPAIVSAVKNKGEYFAIEAAKGESVFEFIASTIYKATDKYRLCNKSSFTQFLDKFMERAKQRLLESRDTLYRHTVHKTIYLFLEAPKERDGVAPVSNLWKQRWIEINKPTNDPDNPNDAPLNSSVFARCPIHTIRASLGIKWIRTEEKENIDLPVPPNGNWSQDRKYYIISPEQAKMLNDSLPNGIQYNMVVNIEESINLRPILTEAHDRYNVLVHQVSLDLTQIKKIENELNLQIDKHVVLRHPGFTTLENLSDNQLRRTLENRGIQPLNTRRARLLQCAAHQILHISNEELEGYSNIDSLKEDELLLVLGNRGILVDKDLPIKDLIEECKQHHIEVVSNMEIKRCEHTFCIKNTNAKDPYKYFMIHKQSARRKANGIAHSILRHMLDANTRMFVRENDAVNIQAPNYMFKWKRVDKPAISKSKGVEAKLIENGYKDGPRQQNRVIDPYTLTQFMQTEKNAYDAIKLDTIVEVGNEFYQPIATPNSIGQFVIDMNSTKRYVHIEGDDEMLQKEILDRGSISARIVSISKTSNNNEIATFALNNSVFRFMNPPRTYYKPGLDKAIELILKMTKLALHHADEHYISEIVLNLTPATESESIWKTALAYALYITKNTTKNTNNVTVITHSRKVNAILSNMEKLDPSDAVMRIQDVVDYMKNTKKNDTALMLNDMSMSATDG